MSVGGLIGAAAMNRAPSNTDEPDSGVVLITVLSVIPARAKKLFAFASVEIDIDGIQIELHGIRASHVGSASAAIELPKFRDADGVWRTAITLPEEIYAPLARAVLDELVERGLTARPADTRRQPLTERPLHTSTED
jgi:stage V sporulation protein G